VTHREPPDRPHDSSPNDEIDVDQDREEGDESAVEKPEPSSALSDEAEYLGSYDSVAAYLRAMLEPEVSAGCAWLLDCLDYEEVQQRWEGGGHRLVLAEGRVYRVPAE
jgi:hypothetical protein